MRKRLLVLALLLVGGAIVNVAVAWGCAAWMPLPARPDGILVFLASDEEKSKWLQEAPRTFSLKPLLSSRVSNWGVHAAYVSADRTAGLMKVTTDSGGRLVTRIFISPTDDTVFFDHAMFVRSGWPMGALHGERWVSGKGQEGQHLIAPALIMQPRPGSSTIINAFAFERSGLDPEYRIIPVAAVPLGFAINTLFYAGILWLLFAAPFAMRRRRRIRRGFCPACAYPIGESDICTECGAPVQRRAAPTP